MVCDIRGVIQWADKTAERLLGARAGMPVAALAAPGCEEALTDFCKSGLAARIARGQLDLHTCEGTATTWCTAVSLDALDEDGIDAAEGGLAILTLVPPQMAGYSQHGQSAQSAIDDGLASELYRQRREIECLTRDLDERNRGIVALHAELDDKAAAAMTSARIKGRAVAGVSHDLRTAIHSILGLSKLLLDELDGPLSAEQKTQVGFIRTAANDLSQMAGDLLDLARLDPGTMGLYPRKLRVAELFGTLRGMLAPLLPAAGRIALVFDAPAEPIDLETDTTKLSQILCHLIINAIKFTDDGEVRVTATREGDQVCFAVRDTGMGIAPEHHEHIFEELTQIHFGQLHLEQRHPGQAHLRDARQGCGLGLPLARKLARMLGGDIAITSHMGGGATFTVTVPAVHADASQMRSLRPQEPCATTENAPVLVVEDDHRTVMRLDPYLAQAGFPVMSARTVQEARAILSRARPAAIVLDIMTEGEASWRFLGQLESAPATRHIPVLVLTGPHRAQMSHAARKGELWLNAAAQGNLLRTLGTRVEPAGVVRVLIIDGDERSRYLVRQLLEMVPVDVVELEAGQQGDQLCALVHRLQPDAIVLGTRQTGPDCDPEMPGRGTIDEQLLGMLEADPRTRQVPVVLLTPNRLPDEERQRLRARAAAFLCRNTLASELAVHLIEKALQSPPACPRRTDHG